MGTEKRFMTEGDLTDVSETSSLFDIIWNFWVRTLIVLPQTEHKRRIEQMATHRLFNNSTTVSKIWSSTKVYHRNTVHTRNWWAKGCHHCSEYVKWDNQRFLRGNTCRGIHILQHLEVHTLTLKLAVDFYEIEKMSWTYDQ